MDYTVKIDAFAEKYYVKSFSKKYKTAWERTLKVLLLEFSRVQILFDKTIAEVIVISPDNNIKICKTEFKIVGTNDSRHSSGNRCIIAIHEQEMMVLVFLIYHKSDILKGGKETVAWKKIIYSEFSGYRGLINLN